MRSHLPEPDYLQKIGMVAYLVSSMEGLLVFSLPRFEQVVPRELNVTDMAGLTTQKIGERLLTYGPRSTDARVAAFLKAGGEALIEIAPLRNAMLHARPATTPERRTRLWRWRIGGAQSEAFWIDDAWLHGLAERIDTLKTELNRLRPPRDRG